VGASAYDHARGLGLKAIGLNGGEASHATDTSGRLGFANKRAEWHWHMREVLDPANGYDVALPPDPELLADLCAARWKPTPRGIQVEPKEQIMERIGRSPDCGEAVIYAFADDAGKGAGYAAWLKEQATGEVATRAESGGEPNHQACRLKGRAFWRPVEVEGRWTCNRCGEDLGPVTR
jgi:hypothetical protein